MRKLALTSLLVLVLIFSTVSLAAAVTDGTLDGTLHPHVVLLFMRVSATEAYRCSGTLLSPTVLLTAGHCTNNYPGDDYTELRVFTESDVQAGIGVSNNYPNEGPNSVEAVSWAAHPLYETGPFFVHDVGVVVLADPIDLPAYGELPAANQFDAPKFKDGNNTQFTSVGYGLQRSFPTAAEWKNAASRTRYFAKPWLLQINTGFTGDFSMLLSNNAASGGTCYGDSGGPNFLGNTNVVAGITSYGLNRPCGGTGGVFRTDRQDVLDFVNAYLE